MSPALPLVAWRRRTMEAEASSDIAASRKVDAFHSLLTSPHFAGFISLCLTMPSWAIHICYPFHCLEESCWKLSCNENVHGNVGPQLLEQMGNSELTVEPGTPDLHFRRKRFFAFMGHQPPLIRAFPFISVRPDDLLSQTRWSLINPLCVKERVSSLKKKVWASIVNQEIKAGDRNF